jgi:hypothetical protein
VNPDVYTLCAPIEGWYSKVELELLHEAACEVREDQMIVEIGSFRGRSLVALAESGRYVDAVDPMKSVPDRAITSEDCIALQQVEAAYPGTVLWHRKTRTNYTPEQYIGLLHIDGDHTGLNPVLDLRAMIPYLAAGALIAFHDFTGNTGVEDQVLREIHDNERPMKVWKDANTLRIFRWKGDPCS